MVVQAYVDEATAVEAEAGGVLAAVKSLVQQPSDIWRKGSMLVSFMDDTVMVCDGKPERICALSGLCAGASRAEPMVTMPGQLIALEVQKLPGATEPCTVLCRSRGSYWAIQVGTAPCLCVVHFLHTVSLHAGNGTICIRAGCSYRDPAPPTFVAAHTQPNHGIIKVQEHRASLNCLPQCDLLKCRPRLWRVAAAAAFCMGCACQRTCLLAWPTWRWSRGPL